ncbi:hypothetical protein HDU76_001127 [Blyttiomyces sp. JEL0837]|nr:hypothetical protein HDU76_001127 [Blyttiomyces sp. JEL0837]
MSSPRANSTQPTFIVRHIAGQMIVYPVYGINNDGQGPTAVADTDTAACGMNMDGVRLGYDNNGCLSIQAGDEPARVDDETQQVHLHKEENHTTIKKVIKTTAGLKGAIGFSKRLTVPVISPEARAVKFGSGFQGQVDDIVDGPSTSSSSPLIGDKVQSGTDKDASLDKTSSSVTLVDDSALTSGAPTIGTSTVSLGSTSATSAKVMTATRNITKTADLVGPIVPTISDEARSLKFGFGAQDPEEQSQDHSVPPTSSPPASSSSFPWGRKIQFGSHESGSATGMIGANLAYSNFESNTSVIKFGNFSEDANECIARTSASDETPVTDEADQPDLQTPSPSPASSSSFPWGRKVQFGYRDLDSETAFVGTNVTYSNFECNKSIIKFGNFSDDANESVSQPLVASVSSAALEPAPSSRDDSVASQSNATMMVTSSLIDEAPLKDNADHADQRSDNPLSRLFAPGSGSTVSRHDLVTPRSLRFRRRFNFADVTAPVTFASSVVVPIAAATVHILFGSFEDEFQEVKTKKGATAVSSPLGSVSSVPVVVPLDKIDTVTPSLDESSSISKESRFIVGINRHQSIHNFAKEKKFKSDYYGSGKLFNLKVSKNKRQLLTKNELADALFKVRSSFCMDDEEEEEELELYEENANFEFNKSSVAPVSSASETVGSSSHDVCVASHSDAHVMVTPAAAFLKDEIDHADQLSEVNPLTHLFAPGSGSTSSRLEVVEPRSLRFRKRFNFDGVTAPVTFASNVIVSNFECNRTGIKFGGFSEDANESIPQPPSSVSSALEIIESSSHMASQSDANVMVTSTAAPLKDEFDHELSEVNPLTRLLATGSESTSSRLELVSPRSLRFRKRFNFDGVTAPVSFTPNVMVPASASTMHIVFGSFEDDFQQVQTKRRSTVASSPLGIVSSVVVPIEESDNTTSSLDESLYISEKSRSIGGVNRHKSIHNFAKEKKLKSDYYGSDKVFNLKSNNKRRWLTKDELHEALDEVRNSYYFDDEEADDEIDMYEEYLLSLDSETGSVTMEKDVSIDFGVEELTRALESSSLSVQEDETTLDSSCYVSALDYNDTCFVIEDDETSDATAHGKATGITNGLEVPGTSNMLDEIQSGKIRSIADLKGPVAFSKRLIAPVISSQSHALKFGFGFQSIEDQEQGHFTPPTTPPPSTLESASSFPWGNKVLFGSGEPLQVSRNGPTSSFNTVVPGLSLGSSTCTGSTFAVTTDGFVASAQSPYSKGVTSDDQQPKSKGACSDDYINSKGACSVDSLYSKGACSDDHINSKGHLSDDPTNSKGHSSDDQFNSKGLRSDDANNRYDSANGPGSDLICSTWESTKTISTVPCSSTTSTVIFVETNGSTIPLYLEISAFGANPEILMDNTKLYPIIQDNIAKSFKSNEHLCYKGSNLKLTSRCNIKRGLLTRNEIEEAIFDAHFPPSTDDEDSSSTANSAPAKKANRRRRKRAAKKPVLSLATETTTKAAPPAQTNLSIQKEIEDLKRLDSDCAKIINKLQALRRKVKLAVKGHGKQLADDDRNKESTLDSYEEIITPGAAALLNNDKIHFFKYDFDDAPGWNRIHRPNIITRSDIIDGSIQLGIINDIAQYVRKGSPPAHLQRMEKIAKARLRHGQSPLNLLLPRQISGRDFANMTKDNVTMVAILVLAQMANAESLTLERTTRRVSRASAKKVVFLNGWQPVVCRDSISHSSRSQISLHARQIAYEAAVNEADSIECEFKNANPETSTSLVTRGTVLPDFARQTCVSREDALGQAVAQALVIDYHARAHEPMAAKPSMSTCASLDPSSYSGLYTVGLWWKCAVVRIRKFLTLIKRQNKSTSAASASVARTAATVVSMTDRLASVSAQASVEPRTSNILETTSSAIASITTTQQPPEKSSMKMAAIVVSMTGKLALPPVTEAERTRTASSTLSGLTGILVNPAVGPLKHFAKVYFVDNHGSQEQTPSSTPRTSTSKSDACIESKYKKFYNKLNLFRKFRVGMKSQVTVSV